MPPNHFNFTDIERRQRAPIPRRWYGLRRQRRSIGFSSDMVVLWASLLLQPDLSANAVNVGFFFCYHDISTHHADQESSEPSLRWVHAFALLPTIRIFSLKSPFHERIPWEDDPTIEASAKEAMSRHVVVAPIFCSLWKLT